MTQIKSEKAKEYIESEIGSPSSINNYLNGGRVAKAAIQAVILAETEVHERAVEAFKKACSCGVQAGIGPKCERFANCVRYERFINVLTK